jgi:hypothetical protein
LAAEDLGVAELALHAGVPFGGLHDFGGWLTVKVCGEIARRGLEAVFGEQLALLRSVHAGWRVSLDSAEGRGGDLAEGRPQDGYGEIEVAGGQHPG